MTLFSKKERKNRETLTFHEKDIHEFFCSKFNVDDDDDDDDVDDDDDDDDDVDDDDDDVFSFIGDKIVLGKKL